MYQYISIDIYATWNDVVPVVDAEGDLHMDGRAASSLLAVQAAAETPQLSAHERTCGMTRNDAVSQETPEKQDTALICSHMFSLWLGAI